MFTPEVMKKQLAHATQRYGPQSRVAKMWKEQLKILSQSETFA